MRLRLGPFTFGTPPQVLSSGTRIRAVGFWLARCSTRPPVDRDARVNVGPFSEGQRQYLEFHRENVLRMARGLTTGEGRR